MSENDRSESYPSLTHREHWGNYAAGMLTEIVFVLGLTIVGYIVALLGTVVWP